MFQEQKYEETRSVLRENGMRINYLSVELQC